MKLTIPSIEEPEKTVIHVDATKIGGVVVYLGNNAEISFDKDEVEIKVDGRVAGTSMALFLDMMREVVEDAHTPVHFDA